MSFSSALEKMSTKLTELGEEIDLLVQKMEKEGKSEDGKRIVSTRSVEPMSRLRKDVEEVKEGQKNPEMQLILDKLGDVFK